MERAVKVKDLPNGWKFHFIEQLKQGRKSDSHHNLVYKQMTRSMKSKLIDNYGRIAKKTKNLRHRQV